jgi:hypothetical protein
MSPEAWIFMVGFRVVDIGALVVWLVWFYRQCDKEDDESDGDDFRRDSGDEPAGPPPPKGGDGLGVPLPDAAPWPSRRRGHEDGAWPAHAPARRERAPHREPVPASPPLMSR